MASFTEITKQVHTINDLILSDMKCSHDDTAEEAVNFGKHLLVTKFWFARISYVNKKRFLLVLLQDVSSAWTLSLLLKSMWNCRPKDAVLSTSERAECFSSYDQVPMDHNRTAIPIYTLSHAMRNDRLWFLSLGPEPQAQVLSELLTIAGGPVMWAVLSRAQTLYSRYQEQMIQNILECSIVCDVNDPHNKNVPGKKDPSPSSASRTPTPTSQAETTAEPAPSASPGQKNLEANLAAWNATIKAMRDSLKLEELEMSFNDGTKRKIWKVNRVRPDVMETVDFLQLLPSSVGKRILSFLPQGRLAECARVNRYWDYLVDEYRAELAARTRINSDFDKLEKIVIKNDESLYQFIAQEDLARPPLSSTDVYSTGQGPGLKKQTQPSVRPSEKSAGAYSLRCISDKRNKAEIAQHPIRNMADLNERMERRGATDENIWKWCKNVIQHAPQKLQESKKVRKSPRMGKKAKKISLPIVEPAGVLDLENVLFPCPLMKHILNIPLIPPLYKDPAEIKPSTKLNRSISSAMAIRAHPGTVKRFSLWTRDLSTLYPVLKIPAYQFPSK